MEGAREPVFRSVRAEDIAEICGFPQNPMELCYIFPSASFPLMPHVLMEQIEKRRCATVMMLDGRVAGFANLYDIETGNRCFIGNLVLGPEFRGHGAGTLLVRHMMDTAAGTFSVRTIMVMCINENTPALRLYMKLGFRPLGAEPRSGPDGRPLVAIRMGRDMG
ncbi:MAG: GNAT family N-acetyltransferase [Spirochaetes bacterium]|nr:GNAT family N-acetyltransferase [Spirochaetota bacterium]